MNSDTSSNSPFPTSGSMGASDSGSTAVGSGGSSSQLDNENTVRRVAQAAHAAVDRLEQTIGTGSERVMGWQQEYGDYAREQVRTNPLAALGVAFAVGIVFSKLFMR